MVEGSINAALKLSGKGHKKNENSKMNEIS